MHFTCARFLCLSFRPALAWHCRDLVVWDPNPGLFRRLGGRADQGWKGYVSLYAQKKCLRFLSGSRISLFVICEQEQAGASARPPPFLCVT